MNLEKQRLADGRAQRDHGGIEALQMSDLQNAPVALGGVDQRARRFERVRDGFLHHHVEAGLHQFAADFGVRDGGRRDHGCVGVLRQFVEAAEHAAPVRLRDRRGPRRVEVINAGQLGVFRLMNDPQMILAERSRAPATATRGFTPVVPTCPDMPLQHTG